jgi:hypothetical protein
LGSFADRVFRNFHGWRNGVCLLNEDFLPGGVFLDFVNRAGWSLFEQNHFFDKRVVENEIRHAGKPFSRARSANVSGVLPRIVWATLSSSARFALNPIFLCHLWQTPQPPLWRSGNDFTTQLRIGRQHAVKANQMQTRRGTSAANLSMNSSGSMTTWLVPSL